MQERFRRKKCMLYRNNKHDGKKSFPDLLQKPHDQDLLLFFIREIEMEDIDPGILRA